MAFDFPSSPTNGQTYTPAGGPTYTYDLAGTKWTISPVSATVNITTGTYTPTIGPLTNVDAVVASVAQYVRVADIVTVSGVLEADTTAASNTPTSISITLPVASDFSAIFHCGGTAVAISGIQVGAISANIANNWAMMQWLSQGTTNFAYTFHFTYRVI